MLFYIKKIFALILASILTIVNTFMKIVTFFYVRLAPLAAVLTVAIDIYMWFYYGFNDYTIPMAILAVVIVILHFVMPYIPLKLEAAIKRLMRIVHRRKHYPAEYYEFLNWTAADI